VEQARQRSGWSATRTLTALGIPLKQFTVQLDNLQRLAIEKLFHREPAAGVRLIAVGELDDS
jgi:hypothetical protein